VRIDQGEQSTTPFFAIKQYSGSNDVLTAAKPTPDACGAGPVERKQEDSVCGAMLLLLLSST
jgi:hypothetical protein